MVVSTNTCLTFFNKFIKSIMRRNRLTLAIICYIDLIIVASIK